MVTTAGREVGLALPTGSLLQPGDIVAVESDWYLEIEGKPEPVLAVTPRSGTRRYASPSTWATATFPWPWTATIFSCPTTRPWSSCSRASGVAWKRRAAIFAPLGGKSWEHGRSALDGHSHVHPHYHHD